jgi:hypothetical protein
MRAVRRRVGEAKKVAQILAWLDLPDVRAAAS